MEKQYGIRLRMGTIVPLSLEQYQKILPVVSKGEGMITIGDRTINIKDISEISPLVELDKAVLRDQKKWRCKHGTIYSHWEHCTCDMYDGKGFIGNLHENKGLLPAKPQGNNLLEEKNTSGVGRDLIKKF